MRQIDPKPLVEDDEDQFERAPLHNDISDFSKQEAFMAAKLPETNERGELLTAPPAERRDNFMSGPPQDIGEGMVNQSHMTESVNDESQMMLEQRNSFINNFQKRVSGLGQYPETGPNDPDLGNLNNLNINSQESIDKEKKERDHSPDMLNMLDELKGGRETS